MRDRRRRPGVPGSTAGWQCITRFGASAVTWTLLIAGTALAAIGLVVEETILSVVGFVVVLLATGQLCREVTAASWAAGLRRLIGLSAPSGL